LIRIVDTFEIGGKTQFLVLEKLWLFLFLCRIVL
jgi:hypothetical protein